MIQKDFGSKKFELCVKEPIKATKFTRSSRSPMIGAPDQCLGCTVLCKSNESKF